MDDGFWFGDIKIKQMDEQGEYGAFRFDCAYQIGEPEIHKIPKLSRIHFDVGFGDKIPSKIKQIQSDSILPGEDKLSWKVYPPEYIFSEKLQTLVIRSSANSRAKDLYDMVILIKFCTNKSALKNAIIGTFKNRKTDLPNSFYDFADNLNLRQIEMAWKTVELSKLNQEFHVVWSQLKDIFTTIDLLFQ